jgi:signal transduction histidine kinase
MDIVAALLRAASDQDVLAAVAAFTAWDATLALAYIDSDADGTPHTITTVASRKDDQPYPAFPYLHQPLRPDDLPTRSLWIEQPEQPLTIENLDEDARLRRPVGAIAAQFPYHAVIVLPIQSEQAWHGALFFYWSTARTFTDEERARLQTLWMPLRAVVAQRQALYAEKIARQQNQHLARDLEIVMRVSAAAAQRLDMQELLDAAVRLTKTHFGLYHVGVYLLDPGATLLHLAAWMTDSRCAFTPAVRRLPVNARYALVARGARLQEVVSMPDTSRAAEFVPNLLLPETRSQVALPMRVGGRMFDLHHRTENGFPDALIAVLTTLADQVAVAVQNARLYAQAQELAVFEERNRLARDLHDRVSQSLYGISLGLHTARELLYRDEQSAQVLSEPLDYAITLSQEAISEMRSLIFEMRPDMLEAEGLCASLRRHAQTLESRHRLPILLTLPDEPSLRFEVREQLYRIAYEALNNAIRHAGASQLTMKLAADADHLMLEIGDNGRGFDTHADHPGHLGLRSMSERAERIGGQFTIISNPGVGTTIRVSLPYHD